MSFLQDSRSGTINWLKMHLFSFKPYLLFQFYISLIWNTALYSVTPSIIHHYYCSEVTDLILISAVGSWWISKISRDTQWHENRVRFYTSTLSRDKNQNRKNLDFWQKSIPALGKITHYPSFLLLVNQICLEFALTASLTSPHSTPQLTSTCCYWNISCYHCARPLSLRRKFTASQEQCLFLLQVTWWVSYWPWDKTHLLLSNWLQFTLTHPGPGFCQAKFISSEL